METFGDGLPCFFDPRVQSVIRAWRALPNPDAISPADFVRLLEDNGAVPSRYHTDGQKPRWLLRPSR